MDLFTQIKFLIRKEIMLEWRSKYALNGILLYVVSTVFVCYLAFRQVSSAQTWNALFWIIMLFASVNAITKSFIQENRARQLYYYTIASPKAIIISKIIYNYLKINTIQPEKIFPKSALVLHLRKLFYLWAHE